MVSDDTEHACFVAQALIQCHDNPDRFQRVLARSLRWWLAALPAGVGFATLRAILRLWLGYNPRNSGVFSAGNGPAMKSPILGVFFGDDTGSLREYVQRSTEITHSDPKAFYGAMAVALAAHHSANSTSVSGEAYLREFEAAVSDDDAGELRDLLANAVQSAAAGEHTITFADAIGSRKGVSGYMYHTVPCVIQTWLRYPEDLAGGLVEVISAGGDTDTTGAVLGGITGARVGKVGIPMEWLENIIEWPRSVAWMERLAAMLALRDSESEPQSGPIYPTPAVPLRNLLFLTFVLAHGIRRLLPPY
jgi:ADP-ribosylglycohydrolase